MLVVKSKISKLFLLSCCLLVLCGCGGPSQYEQDLDSGVQKYKNGEPMTKAEHDAVQDMLDWAAEEEEKNSVKTYDEWD